MLNRLLEFRPPRIAQLLLAVAALLRFLFAAEARELYANPPLGIGLGLLGFAIMTWGWVLFRKFDTAICPSAVNRHLVTGGIYRLSRNPMYLGILLMMTALALFVGSLPFYLVSVIFFFVMDTVFCPYEEEKLAMTFGSDYLLYKKRVRRWL